ncbi:Wadjet anti-phage system protein JetD domain-containing protein [Neolewinella antarctica]|uniref:Wadjet protein JetD C-terminal domain-containing protein n=1 Tax=Neolewinella antarctica TaxID=442734 RepID=A0ABX0XCT9_9BACT|nr:DUF3322 and DUF2220 domain-containing protein [Neolewinella antarctica]NJC27012.1 hypothetical protein [Neolewinella antarctica]
MISPTEIKTKAEKWWPDVLRAYLSGDTYFPQSIPRIGKAKTPKTWEEFARVRSEQAALSPGDGTRYDLAWREVEARSLGRQRFIDGITISSLRQYLTLMGKNQDYERFVTAAGLLRAELPELAAWLSERVLDVLTYGDVWPELIRVIKYFQNDHLPATYYIRELPVRVPTKFIETHKAVISSLLEATVMLDKPAFVGKGSLVNNFEKRYGLKYAQPLVRLRLLDQSLADEHLSGVNDLSLPLNQFNQLKLPLRRVIIMENKTSYLMSFLTLPGLAGTAAIFGGGFKSGILAGAAWLHKVELLYWGDLDAHGLQIVNRLRGHLPSLRTFLMDRATLDTFAEYQVDATPSKVVELPNLTADELDLYDYLNDDQIRLEQERIPVSAVRAVLAELVAIGGG